MTKIFNTGFMIASSLFFAIILLPQAVQARSTNSFLIGEYIKNPTSLKLSREKIYLKTMGKPSAKAIHNSQGDFATYYNRRGPANVTGKAFEARTAIRINRALQNAGNENRLIITALEKRPNDVSDLALLTPKGQVLERYQLKTGIKTARKAVFDSKYADMKIVTPPDHLREIKRELSKQRNRAFARNKPLSPYWQTMDQAIREGRLTDQIAGLRVPKYTEVQASGKYYLEKAFAKQLEEMNASQQRLISVMTKHTPKMIRKTGTAIAQAMKYVGPPLMIVGGAVDIGYGIHEWNEADRRLSAGELDEDIYYVKKHVAASQVFVGTATIVGSTVVILNSTGMTLLATPEPIVTKIAGVVVFAVSVGFVATDYALERIQGQRIEAKRELLKHIDEKARQRIVIDQLQEMAKNPFVPLV